MAFDRAAGRILFFAADSSAPETWTFDVCTNAWIQMHPDRAPQGSGELVYDVDADVTVALDGSNRAWAYDLEADTWTDKGVSPAADVTLRFYDPVSGLVVATGDDGEPDTAGLELWSYEVETDRWTPIRQANRLTVEPRAYVYDASVDRIVAYSDPGEQPGRASTWLFDLRTGTWSGTGAATPGYSYGWFGPPPPAIAYDEMAERTVMSGQGFSAAYDATADRWEIVSDSFEEEACTRPECRQMPELVYDPVNERLVAYGGTIYTTCMSEDADDMWAFDVTARSWSLVVPPSPRPPSLRDLSGGGVASPDPDRSPWIRAKKVTLHGGPFFSPIPGVADVPEAGTPQAPVASVADGLILPECQLWTEGTVWWEETTSDPSSRAWIEIDLGGTYVLDAALVQADVNDEYRLSYRDPETADWTTLWDVPVGEAGGMATRPHQGDASVRWPLERPIVTDALRFEATSGDAQYSVSEIAVFGQPVP